MTSAPAQKSRPTTPLRRDDLFAVLLDDATASPASDGFDLVAPTSPGDGAGLLGRCTGALRVAVVVATTALSTPAWAAVETSVGVGSHDAALGGSYVARIGTPAATYYNPANLVPRSADEEPLELMVGTVYGRSFVRVESLDGSEIAPARPPGATRGLQLGGRFDIGLVEGLSFGATAYLPPDAFQFSIRPDDQIQWFALSDDNRFSANGALGWRVAPWLSIGVGARLLFDIEVITTARVSDIEAVEENGETTFETSARFGEQATIFPRVTPLAGISLRPWSGGAIGLSYRGRLLVDDWGSTQIDGVPGLPALGYDHYFTHFFEPHRLTLGLAQQLGRWSVSADLTYERWSDGLTVNQNRPGLGRFGDTFNPAVGVSWRAFDSIELLGGYRYARAPWDNIGGRSNVMSNDEHAASWGMRVDADPFTLTWAMRVRALPTKTESKDWRAFESDAKLEANPGYPGYQYGGTIVAGSLSAGVRW